MIASLLFPCDHFGEAETIIDAEELRPDHKLLILHGGADISPTFYGEIPRKTSAGVRPSHRDIIEAKTFRRAQELGVPVLGICRGAQLVCALLGGKLYQDVPFHGTGSHGMTTIDENHTLKTVITNSCHHQMMIPHGDFKLLGWVGPIQAKRWQDTEWKTEIIREPEVVLWQKEKVLAVQGHPEWDNTKDGIFAYTMEQIQKYFGV